MHLKTRNVNTCFETMVSLFAGGEIAYYTRNRDRIKIEAEIVKKPSRNGSVMMIDEPVLITYEKPLERILFNQARDANPFFHLYEALWMLAGRNDVASVAYYAKQMKEYSDDGKTLNGAYGNRWRKKEVVDQFCDASPGDTPWQTVDQLDIIVNHLKADPNSRRAVLQMWEVESDLLKIGPENKSLDCCCNLSVMFSLRDTATPTTTNFPDGSSLTNWVKNGKIVNTPCNVLDMTVTNRSNDMIWGMLGANFVHFTFLQEYLAARLGVEVGKYHHFTNNLHVYDWNWKPEEWLSDKEQNYYVPINGMSGITAKSIPLVKDPEQFERELPEFVSWYDGTRNIDTLVSKGPREHGWNEPFLEEVAGRLLFAFALYKAKDFHGAFAVVNDCPADDWRIVATNWLQRRVK